MKTAVYLIDIIQMQVICVRQIVVNKTPEIQNLQTFRIRTCLQKDDKQEILRLFIPVDKMFFDWTLCPCPDPFCPTNRVLREMAIFMKENHLSCVTIDQIQK